MSCLPLRTRSSACSRCDLFFSTRSRWVSSVAPTAATVSSAPITSKATTYLVNSSEASAGTLPGALAAPSPLKSPTVTWPIPAISRMPSPSAQQAASQRCPFSVSLRESAVLTPTSISTNRNSIMTAPV